MFATARSLWRLNQAARSFPSRRIGPIPCPPLPVSARIRNHALGIKYDRRAWSSGLRDDDERCSAPKAPTAAAIKRPRTRQEPSPWNLPNAVTVGRLVAAPLTGYCIVTGHFDLALGGLVYAGASDWLDGFLARRLNLQTVVGSYLDPAADKLLVSTTTVSLAYQHVIPPWLALVIIGRDVALVAGYAALLRHSAGSFAPSDVLRQGARNHVRPHFISKVNTAMQIGLCFAGVASAGDLQLVSAAAVQGIGNVTALTTTASGVSYGVDFLKQRRNG